MSKKALVVDVDSSRDPRTAVRDAYDALTLEIERCDALASLIEDQLADASAIKSDSRAGQLYALSLVARDVIDRHQVVLKQAQALNQLASTAKGGLR